MLKKLMIVIFCLCGIYVTNGQIRKCGDEPCPPRPVKETEPKKCPDSQDSQLEWGYFHLKELICDGIVVNGYTQCRDHNDSNAIGFGDCNGGYCKEMLKLNFVNFLTGSVIIGFYNAEKGFKKGSLIQESENKTFGGKWKIPGMLDIEIGNISDNKVEIKNFSSRIIQPSKPKANVPQNMKNGRYDSNR